MDKSKAIELLGGTVATAAVMVGVSYQAVEKWPDVLPPRIADRVVAAIARNKPELLPAVIPAREANAVIAPPVVA